MANDATIIVGKLNSDELEKSIEKLVKTVNDKMLDAAVSFDTGIGLMEQSLKTFGQNAKTTVNDIKQAFTQLGTTFNDFAKAMAKATSATSGAGSGGGRGSSGGGSGSGSGTASPSTYANTIGELKEQIRLQGKVVDEQQRGTQAAQNEVNFHKALQAQLKDELKSTVQKNREAARLDLSKVNTMPTNDINQATAKLRELMALQTKYTGKGILSPEQWNRLQNAIDKTKQKIESLKSAQPPTMSQVLGMDEKSVEAIARKMAALKRVSIDPNNAAQVRQLGNEYQRLSRLQAEMLGKNVQLTHSNNYLAQSFGYIRNRIVYAFTLGAVTNFTKKLYEVRGEYEMLERSLGILVNSMEKGTEIFNELNEMALKSPFTLIELGTAAKQLTAYNFTAEEVVDTTRRLADISAALGVPMERLTYNLGQIKAQGVLTARDARDFANAGLAIVPMLAQMYTETKRFGDQVVTTAQVYDMMSKKMVSYRDVLNVLYKVTDEGGKFFDFQAKQAGTLKVQIANLNLAFNNMLNDIGTEQQAALSKPLQAMRWVFQNWREIYKAIEAVIVILGIYKIQAMKAFVLTKLQAAYTAYMQLGGVIGMVTNAMRMLTAAVISNPLGALAAVVASVAAGFILLGDSVEEASVDVKKFGENASKTINEVDTYLKILGGVDENSKTYKDTIEKLNAVLEDYGIQTIKEGESLENINKKREKAIELIKEEGAQRQFANQMAAGTENYNNAVDKATQELNSRLKKTVPTLTSLADLSDVRKNADAISQIVAQIVEENIMLIANKTGEEYNKGIDQIFAKIQASMREIGISEASISEQWMEFGLVPHTNIIQDYIEAINRAKENNISYTESITKTHNESLKASKSTMTLTEKIAAYARGLVKPTDDTYTLYNNIARLVKDYARTHNIDFNVRFHAQVPPQWMYAKDLPELQALAKQFAAIAQSSPHGRNVNGVDFTAEMLWERAYDYAQVAKEKEDALQGEAAREKQRQKEAEKEQKRQAAAARHAAAEDRRRRTQAAAAQRREEDAVAKALRDELTIIKEMQTNYEKLRKAGLTSMQALDIVTQGYDKTIQSINAQLTRFGIAAFDAKDFAGKDINQLLETLKSQLATLLRSGKVKRESVKGLEIEIQKLTVEAKAYNLKKITEGLNNELNKLKEEYELAVEMDANPELSEAFKDMFGIDTSDFPNSIDEYMSQVQDLFDNAVSKLEYGALFVDVWKTTEEELREWGEAVGMDTKYLEDLVKMLNTAQGVAKKWARDIVKQTEDMEYKLADTNGKIAIEEKKLQTLRQRLAEETNEKQRHLLELQIRDQEEAIARLRDELFQLLPTYEALFGGIAEHSAVMTRKLTKQLKDMLVNATLLDNGDYLVTDPRGGTATITKKQRGQYLDKVNKEMLKSQTVVEKLKEAFTKGQDGEVDFEQGLEYISEELQKLSNLVNSIGNIAEALGMTQASKETMDDIANSLSGVAQAIQGYVKIKSGDVIGGAVDMVTGVWNAISTWLDNSNNSITRAVERSQKNIARLELAYKDLQNAVEDAYGTEIIMAQKATMANKEAQLQELKRQLTLEESRKGKNKDTDKIIELTGAIKDLEREIANMGKDVVNDLLGISSVGDTMESLMDGFINALRNGEDAMSVFNDSIDDMIANMVKKMLTTKILQPWFEQQWATIQEDIDKRSTEYYNEYMSLLQKRAEAENTGSVEEAFFKELYGMTKQEYLEGINKRIEEVTKLMTDSNNVTVEDIRRYAELLRSGEPIMEENMAGIRELLESLGLIKNTANSNLSALQQGIQGITEDTAGALEAYMNGVSQQVYYQSDILTQIRDAVVTIDNDVMLGTQAQMLLQLQNTYILMQTMAALMNGWTTPSGQGIRVELLS